MVSSTISDPAKNNVYRERTSADCPLRNSIDDRVYRRKPYVFSNMVGVYCMKSYLSSNVVGVYCRKSYLSSNRVDIGVGVGVGFLPKSKIEFL